MRRAEHAVPTSLVVLLVSASMFVGACSSASPASTSRPASPTGTPRHIAIHQDADGTWRLLRDGVPYTLKGAGAHTRLDSLAASGATSFRTWGVGEDTAAQLDEAESLGLSVALGIWLGHVEHGFDWRDPNQLERQRQAVREAVHAYRDHPALLVWGIGNEMEMDNDDPAMWREVGRLVDMVQELDPHHPTMVVTAELAEANADRLREHVPNVHIWGINSYGGIGSLRERLDAAGWDRPYIVTELGNAGDWESGRTSWGAPLEPTSTEKAAAYRDAMRAIVSDPRCLGAYAFLWGRGEMPSDTWYALLGPADVLFEPADVLVEAWRGAPPADRAPTVAALDAPFAGSTVAPGAPLEARLDASDPEGGVLRYAWLLHRDSLEGSGAGALHRCVESEGDEASTFSDRAPTTSGAFRLLGVAIDENGKAAYASARFAVEGTAPPGPSLPFWTDGPFAPSGFMGDATERVRIGRCPPRPGFCQGPCRRFDYRGGGDPEHGWAAVAWMHPEGNWHGDRPGVLVPSGARAVELVAWGARGGEQVTFAVGNWDVDGFSKTLDDLTLSRTPASYRIELDAGLRESVVFGLTWSATDPGPQGMTIHVADVRWVGE